MGLQLCYTALSPFSRKVRMALAYKNISFENSTLRNTQNGQSEGFAEQVRPDKVLWSVGPKNNALNSPLKPAWTSGAPLARGAI